MGMELKRRHFLTHLISKGAILLRASHQVGAKIGYIPLELADILGWIITDDHQPSVRLPIWITKLAGTYVALQIDVSRFSAYVRPLNAYGTKMAGAYVTVPGT